ncbi:MAG: amidohydrolase family protein [Myxococcales bacterium]|nr:amidohydrolase family protein [Myxococcales bacterium]
MRRMVVGDVVDEGVDYVKITVDELPPGTAEMSDAVLTAAVKAAVARGKRAVVHIGDVHKGQVAADAGAALLAHLPWRTPVSAEAAAALGATGVAMTATLAGWHATAAMAEGSWAPSALDREVCPPGLLAPGEGEAADAGVVMAAMRATLKHRDAWAESVRRLHAAGVVMLVGTDSVLPGVYPGASFHEELRRLVAAGIPAGEVLLGATGRAARWIEAAPAFGTVEVGKVADLVLVEGDPLSDITAAAAIVEVWRAGRPVGRQRP